MKEYPVTEKPSGVRPKRPSARWFFLKLRINEFGRCGKIRQHKVAVNCHHQPIKEQYIFSIAPDVTLPELLSQSGKCFH